MELRKNALDYQRAVAFETVCREESADCIVPDSQPDIDRIIDVSAVGFIRDREADTDEVKLRCAARAVVLYTAAEDEGIYSVEVPVSYMCTASMRGVQARDEVVCTALTVAADARMLNPRKVSVRINTACRVGVYRQAREEIAFAASEEGCCVKTGRQAFSYREALAVKNFTLVEDIELGESMPCAQKVYTSEFDIKALEVTLLAGRASVRAQGRVKALYAATDGTLSSIEREFTFTQSADIASGGEEDVRARASFCLRSFELDCAVDMSGEGRYLALSAGVTMNVETEKTAELEVLQDMYGLKKDIVFTLRELALTPPSEDASACIRVSEHFDTAEPVENVILTRLLPDINFERSESEIAAFIMAAVIYKGTDGALYSTSKRLTLAFPAKDADTSNAKIITGEPVVMSAGGGFTLEFDAVLSFRTGYGKKISAVDDAQWGEVCTPDAAGLSAVMTLAGKNEDIWELAKRYRTTQEAIEQANPGVRPDGAEDTLIMIPL